MKITANLLTISTSLMCAVVLWSQAKQQPATSTETPGVIVRSNGTVELPAEAVPVSKFLSREAKEYLIQHLHDMQDARMTYAEKGVPRFLMPYLKRQRVLFPVNTEDQKVAGVHVLVYLPDTETAPHKQHAVLINLHGGGFSGCWPGCAELESRPIAALAGIEVVSIDYRQAPQSKFPAASEDVAAVYKELLKTYRPESVGIYGCSAGGMLTAESIAWFQKHNLPRPGAIGILCASAGEFGGDAAYTSTPLGKARLMPEMREGGLSRLAYFSGADPQDPLVAPIHSTEILAKFPPTLIITGTRAFEMSSAVYTHSQLVKLGVDAELHVWEGLFHGFFYNPDVPESREAYDVIVRFFHGHLGKNSDAK